MSDHHVDPAAKPPGKPATELLAESLAGVLAVARGLRDDVHKAEQARRRANVINLFVLSLLAVLVVFLTTVAWQNNRLTTQVRATSTVLADCTTPGRACYEEGRARGDAAISAVVRISIFVSQCGRLWPGESGPEYDRKIEACVTERLKRAVEQPPASQIPAPPVPSSSPR